MTMTEQQQPMPSPDYISLVHLAAQATPSTEWEVACERAARDEEGLTHGQLPGCACNGEGVAEWSLWFACGCTPGYVLYCTPCKDQMLQSPRIYCTGCSTMFTPGSTGYSLVEPINRRNP